MVLSIWGLDVDELAFVFLAGGAGVVVAGAAIALTMSSARRWAAFLVDVALGVFLLVLVLIIDADAAAMAIGGFIIVLVTSILVRTGTTDLMVG